MHSMLLNYILKLIKVLNFMACIFQQNNFFKRNTVVSNFLTISATGKALVSMSRQKNKFARGHIKKNSFQAEVRQGRKTTLPKTWSNCYISGFSNVRGRSFLPMQNLPEPCHQIIHWTIMPLTFIYVTNEQHVLQQLVFFQKCNFRPKDIDLAKGMEKEASRKGNIFQRVLKMGRKRHW